MGAKIVSAKKGVALIEAAYFPHVDIRESTIEIVEAFGELLGRQRRPRRAVIGNVSTQSETDRLDCGFGFTVEPCNGDLDINDVLRGEVWHGCGANVMNRDDSVARCLA